MSAKTKAQETVAKAELPVRLRQLVAAAELLACDTVEVRALRSHGQVGEPLSVPADLKIEEEVEVLMAEPTPADRSSFLVRGELRMMQGEQPYAAVKAELRITYRFQGLPEPPDDDLRRLFANQVALHHAWPFLRERLAGLCVTVGLPPVLLGLRKLG